MTTFCVTNGNELLIIAGVAAIIGLLFMAVGVALKIYQLFGSPNK